MSTQPLPERALDREGYIIDQSQTGAVPFGLRGSVNCGCGWIAAYNLLLWRGMAPDARRVARLMHLTSPLSGLLGVNILALWLYLAVKGFRPRFRIISKSRAADCGDAGIIAYRVRVGGHYVAYRREDGLSYRYYNALYGREGHVSPMAEFMARRSRWWCAADFAPQGKTTLTP